MKQKMMKENQEGEEKYPEVKLEKRDTIPA
jgi:hypothetical protein